MLSFYKYPLYFVITILFILSFYFYNENRKLKRKIKSMESINERMYGLSTETYKGQFLKRIGSIYANGDLDTQELNIELFIDHNYYKYVCTHSENITTHEDNEITQN